MQQLRREMREHNVGLRGELVNVYNARILRGKRREVIAKDGRSNDV